MIKNRLKQLLKESNISQTDLAEGVGVSKTTINLLYQNKTDRPDLRIIEKICNFLGTTIEGFFYQETEEDTEI